MAKWTVRDDAVVASQGTPTTDRPVRRGAISPEMRAYVESLARLRGQKLPILRLCGFPCPVQGCFIIACGVTVLEAADRFAEHRRRRHA